jgi:drug/metabolite transporter (DMT)-like permease
MSRRGALLFAAMSVIWGVPYLLIKVADRGLQPAVIVSGRTLIGALVLLPLAARAGAIRPVMPAWRWLVLFAALEMALPWYLLTDAERHLTSSMTGLLVAAVPLVGALIAIVSPHGEQVSRTRLVGLGVGVLGVAALLGVDLNLHGAGPRPIIEVLVVAVCYATGPVILARRLAGLPGLGVSALAVSVAAAVYLVPGVLLAPDQLPSAAVIWSVVGLGLVCTALAFVLFYELIAEIGPTRSTVITYLNPAVALALGIVVLGEKPTTGMLIGFPLVLLGSVLATRGPSRPRALAAAEPTRAAGPDANADVSAEAAPPTGGPRPRP